MNYIKYQRGAKMNKRHMLVIFIITLMFVIGCKEKGTEGVKTPESPYIGGSKGLVANFEQMGIIDEQSKIQEIFENESFPIEITLKNKGEDEIEIGDVRIKLLGINTNDFSGIDSDELTNQEAIEKISESNPDGGELSLDFTSGDEDAIYNIPLIGGSHDINLFASIIYNYKTYAAVPEVCLNTKPADTSICKVDEVKDVFSSGAPIQVKSAEEKRAGSGKFAIEFIIENVGNGDVTKPGEEFDIRFNQLSYSVTNPDKWECKSGGRENEARLKSDGQATILCRTTQTYPEDTQIIERLDLILDYDYKELIHQQLRVRKQ
jgi:hypothetical protein